jgi:histidinol dehydrogenase
VGDFLKKMAIVNLPEEDSEELNHYAAIIARAEGLTGHAHAVERRLRGR